MKKFLLILSIISMAAISCADSNGAGGATESTVSKNIPSLLKSEKNGTPNTQQSLALSVSSQATEQQATGNVTIDNIKEVTTGETGHTLLDRLYDTAWVSVESGWDDGQPETEETYIFFNSDSEMVEREFENGILDGRDDYSALQWLSDIQVPADSGNIANTQMPLPEAGTEYSRNACIVKNMEKGDYDTEYEIYFMTGDGDNRVLYVVDGDNRQEAFREFKELLEKIAKGTVESEDRYVLAKAAK